MTAIGAARTADATPAPQTPAGTWQVTPGQPVTVTAGKLRVDTRPVVLGASCGFAFAPSPTGSPLPPSTVSANAKNTRLRCDGRPVLLDGDTAQDSYGNTLKATDPGRLRTE
ncbi:hypothetical protein ACFYWX_39655 [Streptomyces sp. NPDC002888]|uniref:hypothetical protein n=1 Tax=Streptomyces sp. NPDC002888 TaxID=3364668 RepID=UPI003688BBE5